MFSHRFEQSKSLSAIDDNNAISDNVYLGGAWNIDKVFPGFTQSKFCGCITQAYYNGVCFQHFDVKLFVLILCKFVLILSKFVATNLKFFFTLKLVQFPTKALSPQRH